MKWNEFKKEWQKLEKSRKTKLIKICAALLISGGIMWCGVLLWGQYSKELLDDGLKLALTGVMIFSAGLLLFDHIGYIMLRDRIRRLEDGRE